MSGARELVLYDGRRHIGTIIERPDRTCIARDVTGKKLGSFSSVQKAANAITEIDKIFGGADRSDNA
jgi:hypothetical protein